MHWQQKRSFQAFRRVRDWLTEHPILAALVAPFRTALGTVLDSLSEAAVKQDSHFRSAKGATAESTRLRRELVADHMRLIARAARAAIPDVVAATAALQMPKKGIDVEGVRNAADAMATASEKHQEALTKAGLATDAIAQLREASARYQAALDARGQMIAQRRGATTAIDLQLDRGRRLVDTISVLVTRALRSDPPALAEWEQLKRVTLKGVQETDEEVVPETTPGPASAESPAPAPQASDAAPKAA